MCIVVSDIVLEPKQSVICAGWSLSAAVSPSKTVIDAGIQLFMFIFLKCVGHSFAFVASCIFLRDVWI